MQRRGPALQRATQAPGQPLIARQPGIGLSLEFMAACAPTVPLADLAQRHTGPERCTHGNTVLRPLARCAGLPVGQAPPPEPHARVS
ncbi:hypothetical protein CCO03_16755 [Comamonas serinivorans]|uniref:Uncharacterized protein n=2 Tax=Comamonas serinivorans TaxID=1082851 RepID=A0A1Y0ES09_9BURK|nr:hypothetical protein CCO03_16755 [Comamonas serinivorans]